MNLIVNYKWNPLLKKETKSHLQTEQGSLWTKRCSIEMVCLDKELITLGCVRSKLDTACYIYREEGQLAGIACIYVDVIAAGHKTFNKKVL